MLRNVSYDGVGQLTYTFERTTTHLLVGIVARHHRSTKFSHELLVGMTCMWNRGCRVRYRV